MNTARLLSLMFTYLTISIFPGCWDWTNHGNVPVSDCSVQKGVLDVSSGPEDAPEEFHFTGCRVEYELANVIFGIAGKEERWVAARLSVEGAKLGSWRWPGNGTLTILTKYDLGSGTGHEFGEPEITATGPIRISKLMNKLDPYDFQYGYCIFSFTDMEDEDMAVKNYVCSGRFEENTTIDDEKIMVSYTLTDLVVNIAGENLEFPSGFYRLDGELHFGGAADNDRCEWCGHEHEFPRKPLP